MIAIYIALGGVAVAARTAPKNSVTSKSIKNGQVKTADVRDDTLTSADIGDGQVGTLDLAVNSVTGQQVDEASLTGVDAASLGGVNAGAFLRDGAAAGGDLSGSYPQPALVAGAVNSGKVANDSLTGEDVNESTLGRVPDADLLDGINSSAFLQGGAGAGGDLAGTYPSPSIALGAVTTAKFATLPAARFSEASAVAHATPTAWAFDDADEEYDTATLHDASAPSRFTAPVGGVYGVSAWVAWEASAAGTMRVATLRVNGTSDISAEVTDPPGSVTASQTVSTMTRLGAGDYVELVVLQDTGAPLNAAVALAMTWLSPG